MPYHQTHQTQQILNRCFNNQENVLRLGLNTLYDVNETEVIYGSIVLAGASTVDTTIWMEYK